jgi:hypothetical protein
MEDWMIEQVFNPAWGNTTSVNNATSATAAVVLPGSASEVCLTNTSTSARVHVMVTPYDGVVVPTGVAPTLTTGLPILPQSQIRVRVGPRQKVIRTIATAADGAIIITPGNGG